jgi:hypothetical protein
MVPVAELKAAHAEACLQYLDDARQAAGNLRATNLPRRTVVAEQHPVADKDLDKREDADIAPPPRWQGREQGSSTSFSYSNLSHPAADPQLQSLICSGTRERAVYAKSA